MKNYTTHELMSAFIEVLCATKISEATIHGITEMLWDNKPAMDEVVTFIKENPQATESDIIKATSRAIHIKY